MKKGKRGRPPTVVGGKKRVFYLGLRERMALLVYRRQHKHSNDSECLRNILSTVADLVGLPVDPEECLNLLGASPELAHESQIAKLVRGA